eukprot:2155213-Rhodomonas_salina.1
MVLRDVRYCCARMLLRVCYAMRGTEVAYDATPEEHTVMCALLPACLRSGFGVTQASLPHPRSQYCRSRSSIPNCSTAYRVAAYPTAVLQIYTQLQYCISRSSIPKCSTAYRVAAYPTAALQIA